MHLVKSDYFYITNRHDNCKDVILSIILNYIDYGCFISIILENQIDS